MVSEWWLYREIGHDALKYIRMGYEFRCFRRCRETYQTEHPGLKQELIASNDRLENYRYHNPETPRLLREENIDNLCNVIALVVTLANSGKYLQPVYSIIRSGWLPALDYRSPGWQNRMSVMFLL